MFALVPIQLVLPHAYEICAEQDFDGASPYIEETSGPRAQPYTAQCSVWFSCVACTVVYVVTVAL